MEEKGGWIRGRRGVPLQVDEGSGEGEGRGTVEMEGEEENKRALVANTGEQPRTLGSSCCFFWR